MEGVENLTLLPPQPYIDFLSLLQGSALILSDSGSVQAEAGFFGTPCLVCRENTERPIYLQEGTSTLVGRDIRRLKKCLRQIASNCYKKPGQLMNQLGSEVAEKTVRIIADYLS
jgi:UDP-N-acetylglucosamine 2-epimerase (non-hydrolysing)